MTWRPWIQRIECWWFLNQFQRLSKVVEMEICIELDITHKYSIILLIIWLKD